VPGQAWLRQDWHRHRRVTLRVPLSLTRCILS